MDIFITLITVLSAIMGIIPGIFKLCDSYKNRGKKEPATSLRAEPRGNLTLDEIENILINKFQIYAGVKKYYDN